MTCLRCILRPRYLSPDICPSCRVETLWERKERAVAALAAEDARDQRHAVRNLVDLSESPVRTQRDAQQLREYNRQRVSAWRKKNRGKTASS